MARRPPAAWLTARAPRASPTHAHPPPTHVLTRPKDVLASASRDGTAMVWDLRCSGSSGGAGAVARHRPVRVVRGAHVPPSSPAGRRRAPAASQDPQRSVTSALFLADGHRLATAGASDGLVKLWDLRDVRVGGHNLRPEPAATLRPHPGQAARRCPGARTPARRRGQAGAGA